MKNVNENMLKNNQKFWKFWLRDANNSWLESYVLISRKRINRKMAEMRRFDETVDRKEYVSRLPLFWNKMTIIG